MQSIGLKAPPTLARDYSSVQFRHLLEKLPATAYTCDSEGLITYYNGRATELWGREPKLNDPIDRYCGSFKLFSADGQPIKHEECWMALALRNNQEYNGQEILIERPDGSRRAALAHANPFHDDEGNVFGAVNVLVDITSRKELENTLREADRRKTEFLAMLSHELRNPLAPIRNGLQIMRLAACDAQTMDEVRKMMERQLGQMVHLIDDLLDLSRITSGKIILHNERLDLTDVVHDAVEATRPLIEACGHDLAIALPQQPIYVEGDRTRLSQIFSNLLNNSAKYTDRGGKVELVVERQGSDVVINVKDNGIGIPTEMLPRLFEMFTQVDHSLERTRGGLGIGLNLVMRLVTMHGGSVSAASGGPGKGSEFTVRLPVSFKPFASKPKQFAGHDSVPAAPKYRILVVDDNQDSAVSMAMMLRVMGHFPRTAHDGLDALEEASAFRPNIVLLDIGLPKMNGYDVCRKIREQPWGKELVLIALTGWGQDEDKRKSKEAGFSFHLVKPVDIATLQKLLAGLLVSPA